MLANIPTATDKTYQDNELPNTVYDSGIEYEIKPQNKFSLNLKELWQYRELFYFFTLRDVKVKYKQAYLGMAWVVLQPLFMVGIFSMFFGRIIKIPVEYDMPYPLFALSGIMFWNIFSSGLANSGDSMVANANIIKKIYFPRLVIPISSIMVSLLDFIIVFGLFIGFLLYYQHMPNLYRFVCLFPLGLIITVITTFGLGTLLSALNVKFRDFRYIIPFLIQSTLFVTPVFFPTAILPMKWLKYTLALNPLTGAIVLSRAAISSTITIDWNIILISTASSIIILIAGLSVFRKTEAYFADLA